MENNKKIAMTKRILQETLIELLKDKPIDKICVTELCREAEINRSTFYRHYNTPRDVLLEMEINMAKDITSNLELLISSEDTVGVLEKMCRYFYIHSDTVKIFIENNSMDEILVIINDCLSRMVKRNKDKIDLSFVDQNDLKLIYAYVAGGGYFMLRHWLMQDIQKSPKEIAELINGFMDYSVNLYINKHPQK